MSYEIIRFYLTIFEFRGALAHLTAEPKLVNIIHRMRCILSYSSRSRGARLHLNTEAEPSSSAEHSEIGSAPKWQPRRERAIQ